MPGREAKPMRRHEPKGCVRTGRRVPAVMPALFLSICLLPAGARCFAEAGEQPAPLHPDPNASPPTEKRLMAQYRTALEKLGEKRAAVYVLRKRHFAVLPDGRLLVVTSEYSRRTGYLGVSVLALVLDHRQRLRKVIFVDSPDTPTYVKIVRIRMKRLLGQRLRERHRPVLAITGATCTADAVSDMVNETLDQLAEVLTGMRIGRDGAATDAGPLAPARIITAP